MTLSSKQADRNAAIYKAVTTDKESAKAVGKVHNLSERRVRDIVAKYAVIAANGSANGNGNQPTPPPISPMEEIGRSGLHFSAGYVQEEFLRELATPQQRYRMFEEMRVNSPDIASLLLAVELPLRRMEWMMEGDDPRSVDFVESCREDMSHSWNDHISGALTMIPFGWSFHETVYKRRLGPYAEAASDYTDGRIGWRKLAFRSQDSLLRWVFNGHGDAQAMVQATYPDFQPITLPFQKAILYRTTREKNNPEGRSLLRPAYIPYYMVKNLQSTEAIAAERDLAGLPVVTLPDGATTAVGSTDIANAQTIVRNVRVDEQAGVVKPPGWGFELLSAAGSKQIDLDAVITRYKKDMMKVILAQFLMLGMDGKGAYALSKDQSDFFVMALGALADIIAETFSTYAIPRLLKLNGMPLTNAPRLTHGPIGTADLEALGSFLNQTIGANVIHPDVELEKHVRKLADLPEAPAPTVQPPLQTPVQGTPRPAPAQQPATPIPASRALVPVAQKPQLAVAA